jgi:hypothetical protein
MFPERLNCTTTNSLPVLYCCCWHFGRSANQMPLYSANASWWSWRFYRLQLITPLQLSLTLSNTWWQVYNRCCWRPVWLRDVGVTVAVLGSVGRCYGNLAVKAGPQQLLTERARDCWDCAGTVLGLCWGSARFVLGLCSDSVGFTLGLRWDCVGTLLGLCWDSVGFVLGLRWVCAVTVMGMCWDCAGIVLGLCWDCVGTVLDIMTLCDPTLTAV